MKAIVKLVKDLNKLYSDISWKVKVSIALMVVVCFINYYFCKFISIVLNRVFVPEISLILCLVCVFFSFAMFFDLAYGTIVLITRLVRKEKASIGYLFLGFNTSRATGPVWVFSGLLSICFAATSLPVFYFVDFSKEKYIFAFLKNAELMSKITFFSIAFFVISFIAIFFRYAFVWNIVYDDENMTKLKPFIKSWKMFNGNVFHFFMFEFVLCIKYLLITFMIEALKFLQTKVTPSYTDSYFNLLFNIVGFLTIFAMFSKVAVSIPFLYERYRQHENHSKEEQ